MMAAIWPRWGSSLGLEFLMLTFSSASWSRTDTALVLGNDAVAGLVFGALRYLNSSNTIWPI
ncbi:hypothetical protein XI08_19055 [Bradyrhizobium sp. CCBAU 11361]|nr:hypothetical protein [Bradyrhizobium sp. CCBAU 11361]